MKESVSDLAKGWGAIAKHGEQLGPGWRSSMPLI